jgi:hypothetical protein
MGPDTDPMAVVDQSCRVKGVRGLWVADAFGGCGKACDWRRDCSNSMRIGTWPITGSSRRRVRRS